MKQPLEGSDSSWGPLGAESCCGPKLLGHRQHAGTQPKPIPISTTQSSTAWPHRAVLRARPEVLGARGQQVHPGRGGGEVAVGLAALWAVPA